MVGREAYHNPWLMADWDARFFGDGAAQRSTADAGRGRDGGLHAAQQAAGVPWAHARATCWACGTAAGRAPLAPGVVRPPAEGAAVRQAARRPMRLAPAA
jgi:tRNA-dihydrouridine synthase